MIYMKRLFLSIITLLTLTVEPAYRLSGQSKSDPGAILEKTLQVYKAWGGMVVKFTFHSRNEQNGASESFEGILRMKNEKFVMTTPEMMVWFDGTTQWT